MAVRSKDEIMEMVNKLVGDDNSDESLAIIEDVSDTLDAGSDGGEWKNKYDELDKEWREKYRKRFFETGSKDKEKEEEKEEEKEKEEDEEVTIDDLFEEKKEG